MSSDFAAFVYSLIAGPVYAASALVGVSALLLVLISTFKDLFKIQEDAP